MISHDESHKKQKRINTDSSEPTEMQNVYFNSNDLSLCLRVCRDCVFSLVQVCEGCL